MLKQNNKGFTLLELIVILVIIGILAALLIPALTGYIDKANEKKLIAECRNAVTAAQTLSSEKYGKEEVLTLDADKATIQKLGELPQESDITELETGDRAVVTKLVYQAVSGKVVTYQNGEYSIGEAAVDEKSKFGVKDNMTTIKNTFNIQPGKNCDSGAVNKEGSTANETYNKLAEAGLDLTKMGATSWRCTENKFYWTPVDISSLTTGTKIPVMSYNFTSGNYVVWNMTVKSFTSTWGTYNVLEKETGSPLNPKGEQSYDEMYTAYEKATK